MSDEFLKTRWDEKWSYSINLKRAAVLTLFFLNLVSFFSPRVNVDLQETPLPRIVIDVENIPITRHARRTPPPPKPKVPVPSDDETIPEDLTIEETDLKYTNIYDITDGLPQLTGVSMTPPKLINWAAPEMPKDELKRGVSGIVKLSVHVDRRGKVVEVVVMENTTNSSKCEQAAIEAAYNSRFFPAREGNKAVDGWSWITYGFNSGK